MWGLGWEARRLLLAAAFRVILSVSVFVPPDSVIL